jgi:hypothetical protein
MKALLSRRFDNFNPFSLWAGLHAGVRHKIGGNPSEAAGGFIKTCSPY